jgi:hypothetical protein
VLDTLVAEVGLQRSGIDAIVGELEPAGVPQHVRVSLDLKAPCMTSTLFTMVWNRSRDLELNGLGPFIGSNQISDLPRSEQKEDTMVKKKKAKKAKK